MLNMMVTVFNLFNYLPSFRGHSKSTYALMEGGVLEKYKEVQKRAQKIDDVASSVRSCNTQTVMA